MKKKHLRDGYTTGSCATAASIAALTYLLTGSCPETVRTPLPPFRNDPPEPRAWTDIPLAACGSHPGPATAEACVRKDGGDDIDATHGALISVRLTLADRESPCADASGPITILGGDGVGRITLPGLPLPVGSSAINPVPREQIRFAVRHTWEEHCPASLPPVRIVISVEHGEEIARHTLNPRLGITGGISILGTHGIVRPYSNDAFMATILEQLQIAEAMHCGTVFFSTGRRSEHLLEMRYPDEPPCAFIQTADFIGYALQQAARLQLSAVFGCFFGKLVKLASGCAVTHARLHPLELSRVAEAAGKCRLKNAGRFAGLTTAAHALELLLAEPGGLCVLRTLKAQAAEAAGRFAGAPVRIHLFHMNGKELVP